MNIRHCEYCNGNFPDNHFTDTLCTGQLQYIIDNMLGRISKIEEKLGYNLGNSNRDKKLKND